MPSFGVGDKAVYPNHGVGVVKGIVSLSFDNVTTEFYELLILQNASIIKVPVVSAETNGLRAIIPSTDVDAVYEVLRDRSTPAGKETWNRRYREYLAKIKTGDLRAVGAVLRDLAILKKEKPLSFGERKTYDQALLLIVQEIAVARDVDERVITQEIQDIFAL